MKYSIDISNNTIQSIFTIITYVCAMLAVGIGFGFDLELHQYIVVLLGFIIIHIGTAAIESKFPTIPNNFDNDVF